MVEANYEQSHPEQESAGFKEAVCIDAMRIYDSCSDKDCLEDLRVYFTPQVQAQAEDAVSVRLKSVEVLTVYLDLEPVPFHKGFYSIDMTFFFDVGVDLYDAPASSPSSVNGLSLFSKKVILYGSEGNVKMFSSDHTMDNIEDPAYINKALPKATCQVAEPIGLSARLGEAPCRLCECCHIPECICRRYGGEMEMEAKNRIVYVTIGLFTIIQIVRNVQMLIPAYDFCIPEKECVTSSDNPCELFRRIEFPTDEFFPPKVNDCGCEGGCLKK